MTNTLRQSQNRFDERIFLLCSVFALAPSCRQTSQIDLFFSAFCSSASLILLSSLPPAPTPFSSVVRLDDKTFMLFFNCSPFSLAIHLEELKKKAKTNQYAAMSARCAHTNQIMYAHFSPLQRKGHWVHPQGHTSLFTVLHSNLHSFLSKLLSYFLPCYFSLSPPTAAHFSPLSCCPSASTGTVLLHPS